MKLYNMLTWPQNTRNPISSDLNFKDLQGKDAPEPPLVTTFSSLYLKHFSKILYPPQYKALEGRFHLHLNASSIIALDVNHSYNL